MSEKKEIIVEELEKITGGDGQTSTTKNVIVKYQETVGGMELSEDLGRYPIADAEANGESMAKEWCALNNKIYAGWYLADLLTYNFDTKLLLDSVGN